MRSEIISVRRRQLDDQLLPLGEIMPGSAPQGGWVRAIRQALGMSVDAFTERLNISRQAVRQLELSEEQGRITLNRLSKAADALGCDVRYVLIPREPLQQIVERQALRVAGRESSEVNHTMRLENQALMVREVRGIAKRLADEMVQRNDPRIWKA